MASSTLIGTAPDQVPTNGDLGDLAFQNKESVEIVGGTISASSLYLNPIYKQINDSATKVFVYDTSKDSDGGLWRARSSECSWYRETLNTQYRGSKKEFPSVVVIALHPTGVAIYDATTPDLSMWMRLDSSISGSIFGRGGSAWNGNNACAVYAANGMLYLGNLSNAAEMLVAVDFILDTSTLYVVDGYGTYGGTFTKGIAERHAGNLYDARGKSLSKLATTSGNVLHITGTILPASITKSGIRGIPKPTLSICTDAGLVVLKYDGSSVSGYNRGFVMSISSYIESAISGPYIFVAGAHISGVVGYEIIIYPFSGVFGYSQDTTVLPYSLLGYQSSYPYINVSNGETPGGGGAIVSIVSTKNDLETAHIIWSAAPGTGRDGVVRSYIDPQYLNLSMVNYITGTYNTGWIYGDTKLVALSDSVTGTISSSNIASGYNAANNWVRQSSITITSSGNNLNISGNGSGSSVYFYLALNVTPNTNYSGYLKLSNSSISNLAIAATTYSTSNILVSLPTTASGSSDVPIFFNSGNNTVVYLQGFQISASTSTISDLSISMAELDRSYNKAGLECVGNFSKYPVSPGSDLVGYSATSPLINGAPLKGIKTNINHPINTVGASGDITISTWFNITEATGKHQLIFSYGDDVAGEQNVFRLMVLPGLDGLLLQATNNGFANAASAAYDSYNTGYKFITNTWYMLTATRCNGVWYYYINDKQVGTHITTYFQSFSGSRLHLVAEPGVRFALFKVSATRMDNDILLSKIYNDEKALFNQNTLATISDKEKPKTLSYDKSEDLLYVGTNNSISVFKGMCRVNTIETAVNNYVHAENGTLAYQ